MAYLLTIHNKDFATTLNPSFNDNLTEEVVAIELFITSKTPNRFYIQPWDFMGNPLNNSRYGYFDKLSDILLEQPSKPKSSIQWTEKNIKGIAKFIGCKSKDFEPVAENLQDEKRFNFQQIYRNCVIVNDSDGFCVGDWIVKTKTMSGNLLILNNYAYNLIYK